MKNIIKTAFVLGLIGGSYLWSEGTLAQDHHYSHIHDSNVSMIRDNAHQLCRSYDLGTDSGRWALDFEASNTVDLLDHGVYMAFDKPDLVTAGVLISCKRGTDPLVEVNMLLRQWDRLRKADS